MEPLEEYVAPWKESMSLEEEKEGEGGRKRGGFGRRGCLRRSGRERVRVIGSSGDGEERWIWKAGLLTKELWETK